MTNPLIQVHVYRVREEPDEVTPDWLTMIAEAAIDHAKGGFVVDVELPNGNTVQVPQYAPVESVAEDIGTAMGYSGEADREPPRRSRRRKADTEPEVETQNEE